MSKFISVVIIVSVVLDLSRSDDESRRAGNTCYLLPSQSRGYTEVIVGSHRS